MIERLNRKQQQMANARIKGKKLKEIAVIHYPGTTEHSGEVQVSRELNKPWVAKYIEQGKLIALKEANITWKRIIAPINKALDFSEGKPVENINIQLRASKDARELMQAKDIDDQVKDELKTLPNVDEIQLIRLMKNTKT